MCRYNDALPRMKNVCLFINDNFSNSFYDLNKCIERENLRDQRFAGIDRHNTDIAGGFPDDVSANHRIGRIFNNFNENMNFRFLQFICLHVSPYKVSFIKLPRLFSNVLYNWGFILHHSHIRKVCKVLISQPVHRSEMITINRVGDGINHRFGPVTQGPDN